MENNARLCFLTDDYPSINGSIEVNWDCNRITPLEHFDFSKQYKTLGVVFYSPDFSRDVASRVSVLNGNLVSKHSLDESAQHSRSNPSKADLYYNPEKACEYWLLSNSNNYWNHIVYVVGVNGFLYEKFFYQDSAGKASYVLEDGKFFETLKKFNATTAHNGSTSVEEMVKFLKRKSNKNAVLKKFPSTKELFSYLKEEGFSNPVNDGFIYAWDGKRYPLYFKLIETVFPASCSLSLYPFSVSELPIWTR